MLIFGFVVLVVIVCFAFNLYLGLGPFGYGIAIVIAGGGAFFSYWKSDSVALAMARAKPANPQQYARLHNLVEGLCIAGGLPKPRLYIVDDPAPNAFATGRNPSHAAVAVTTGLLERMNRVELEGVLAHELSHIKNYDILVSTLAVTCVGIIVLLGDFSQRMLWFGGGRRRGRDSSGGPAAIFGLIGLVFVILSPIFAKLMQAAVSRRREALADVSGVAMTRYPPGLINALEKLKEDSTVVRAQSRATAHLWIEQPMAGRDSHGQMSGLNGMFDTHPPLDQRIAALREL